MYDIDLKVKKVIAKDFERIIEDCSFEEYSNFVKKLSRPDFEDESILAIKFILFYETDSSYNEESKWYLNPVIEQRLPRKMWEALKNPKGPFISGDIVPEILFITKRTHTKELLELYDDFRRILLRTNQDDLSDNQKYELFLKFIANK